MKKYLLKLEGTGQLPLMFRVKAESWYDAREKGRDLLRMHKMEYLEVWSDETLEFLCNLKTKCYATKGGAA